MFGNSTRLHAVVGGAVGLNLLLGVGIAAGVVPHPQTTQTVAAIASAPEGAAVVTEAAAAETAASTSEPAAAPDTTPATTTPTVATPRPTTTVAPAPEPEPEPAPAPTAAPASAAKPKTASRPNPSSAQVLASIGQLRARLPLFNVTEDQARQFGDQVCDAFDAGSSYSSVRAQVLQAVSGVPLLTVTAADADFAIRSAVQLFCPAHSSKLP